MDADVLGPVCSEERKAGAAQCGEIVGAVVFANARTVFGKRSVQGPMQLIFDRPMRADDGCELVGIVSAMTAKVIARFRGNVSTPGMRRKPRTHPN